MSPEQERERLRALVWERLEAREVELIELCQQLVRIPSVNGIHPEEEIARAIAGALEAAGVDVQRRAFAPSRPALVASVGTGERGMLFVGHMDTVAVGDPTAWSVDPFAGEIRGGRLIGRGACDNKAGIAIGVLLLSIFQEWNEQLPGRVLLCCVPDEESGATGKIGITPLLDEGLLDAGQAIYTYPGLDLLSIGHRGVLRVQVVARGEATHTGGEPWERGEKGANATTALAELLLALEQWQPAFEPHPAFPGRRPVVTPGTLLSGGGMVSMVPDRAEATVDMRLLPGQQGDMLLAEMQQIGERIAARRAGIRFEWEPLVELPAVSIPAESPIVRSLTEWTERFTGVAPTIAGAGPANEGYLLIQAGIPTICGFGPPGGNAHGADEYVEVEGLLLAAKIYAAATLDVLLPDA